MDRLIRNQSLKYCDRQVIAQYRRVQKECHSQFGYFVEHGCAAILEALASAEWQRAAEIPVQNCQFERPAAHRQRVAESYRTKLADFRRHDDRS